MVNPQKRSETSRPIDYGPLTGTGIHYFRAPINSGPEVRFPRPPVVTKPVTKKHAFPREKPVTIEPQEDYAHYEAQWEKKRLIAYQCLAIIFLTSFFTFPHIAEFLLVKFGPVPSPLIIPPPPYYAGETIKGLSTKGAYHTWIYYEKAGWVDP